MKSVSFVALVGALCVVTLVSLLMSDGNLVVAVAPVLLMAVLYVVSKLPLRYPVLLLTFLALTLEPPSEASAEGLWKGPLALPGAILLSKLNLTFPAQKWLIFSGLDLVLIGLFGLAFWRWISREREHAAGPAESASPMGLFAWICLGGATWMWVWGMGRGGADFASSLWQVQRVIYLPIACFLFQLSLRGPGDAAALGKVVVASACIKACFAIYVRNTVAPRPGELMLGYATTHADSMLFACAFCMVVTLLIARPSRTQTWVGLLVLPLLMAGMVANNRRIVWVEVIAGLLTVYLLSPWSIIKRRLAQGAVLASPLGVLYVLVGWGSGAKIFKPVQTIRSVVDSTADMSTAWRDWENYNLFFTLKQNPLLGSGYGHGYIETVKLPDISAMYSLYRFIPHNSILGLWAYGGLVGFAALWTLLVVGIFFAVRAAKHATKPFDRVAALSATAFVVVYLVHAYGDMGLGTWTSVFTVGPALAIASQLAVATGAWPSKIRRPSQPPVIVVEVDAPRPRPNRFPALPPMR